MRDARMAKVRLAPYGRGFGQPAASTTCAPVFPGRSIRLCMQRVGKMGPTLRDASSVCQFVRKIGARDRESFWALHLDVRGQVIGVEEVARGSLSGVEVHPREVFKSAILNNAAAILIAHNHPSGDASPSRQDIELTKRLADTGQTLGIPLRDHVIVGDPTGRFADCISLRERGEGGIQFGRAQRRRRRR
jgi:DNA repair protein RadC